MRTRPGANVAPAAPAGGTRLRGYALTIAGVAALTLMDGMVKHLSATYPVTEIVFFRCALALPFLLLPLHWQGGAAGWHANQPGLQILRGLCAAATGLLFFSALTLLPLADTIAISFAAPFIVAALSAPLLGEPVPRSAWLAIGLGFAGVVVVTRPGDAGLGPGAILALAAALTYALNAILLRRVGRLDAAITTTVWGTIVAGLAYAVLMAPDFRLPALADWPLLACVGAAGALGTLALSAAYRLAPAAQLATLEYSAIPWAIAIGLVLFGEVPGPTALAGALLIVVSGVLLTRMRH